MTLVDDTIRAIGHMRPIDRQILSQGMIFNMDPECPRPFSYLDFCKIPHGTFRNSISRLMRIGRVYVVIEGHPKFYACKGSGIKPRLMTPTHMGGAGRIRSLEEILLFLGDAVVGLHDIRLLFHCSGLYSSLRLIPAKYSEDKRLLPMRFESGRTARIVTHRTDSVSVVVGCSDYPFPRDNLCELFFILERIRDRIQFRCLQEPIQVPPVADWMVTMWHYNRDGNEIAGERFEVTFRDLSNVLYRFYGKSTSAGQFRPRLEKIESPKQTLREIAQETLDSG